MYFAFDKYGVDRPQLILCELSKKRLGIIHDISLSMNVRWIGISEIEFTTPEVITVDGVIKPNELYSDVREKRLVYMPKFGYFQIRKVFEVSDGIRKVKGCVAYSVEVMLQQKQVIDLHGEFRLYDPIRPYESLMGILLLKIPGWKIGNVDGTLLARWRTMDVSKQNLYTLLTRDIADAYECLFIFDHENYLINIVDVTRQFKDTSIYLSYDNLIKNSTIDAKTDNIVTALHVSGGNIDIAGVNPNGTDVIFNVNYFKNRMSQGLLKALNSYEALYATLQPIYAGLLTQLRDRNRDLATLINNPPQYEVRFPPTNNPVTGTATIDPALSISSGLNQFMSIRRALEGVKSVRIEHGNIPYDDINALIGQIDPMIGVRHGQITAMEAQIAGLSAQLRDIVDQLKMENHFTDEQWVELNRYFIYDHFQEDGLIVTDLMTQAERQEIQQELFDLGSRVLARASYPKFEIGIDSVNFPFLPEFKQFTDQFELGTTFTLDLDYFKIKPLLLEVFIDYENPTNFQLVFANKHTLDSNFSLVDFNSSNINAINTISFDLVRLEAMKRQADEVTRFINGALDASRNELISSPTRTAITIDEFGLRARSYDWDTGRANGLEAWLTGSQLAFSDDAFTTARLALGRVNYPGSTGGSGYGLVAEVISGHLLAGNELHISNVNNNFILNEQGAFLENALFNLNTTVGGVRREITLDPRLHDPSQGINLICAFNVNPEAQGCAA